MSRTQESRLTKLEQTGDGRPIIVWCDDPAQVESRIADMIGAEAESRQAIVTAFCSFIGGMRRARQRREPAN